MDVYYPKSATKCKEEKSKNASFAQTKTILLFLYFIGPSFHILPVPLAIAQNMSKMVDWESCGRLKLLNHINENHMYEKEKNPPKKTTVGLLTPMILVMLACF
jgi:hypothetical protein